MGRPINFKKKGGIYKENSARISFYGANLGNGDRYDAYLVEQVSSSRYKISSVEHPEEIMDCRLVEYPSDIGQALLRVYPHNPNGTRATARFKMALGEVLLEDAGTVSDINDDYVVTVVGGTLAEGASAATFTVTVVDDEVTVIGAIGEAGEYVVLPSNPITVTGLTGTAPTFNVRWSIVVDLEMTNLGSGYGDIPRPLFFDNQGNEFPQTIVEYAGGSGSDATITGYEAYSEELFSYIPTVWVPFPELNPEPVRKLYQHAAVTFNGNRYKIAEIHDTATIDKITGEARLEAEYADLPQDEGD